MQHMLFLTVEILFHHIINGHLQPPQHDCNEAACASATDQVKNVACEERSIGAIERMRKLIYYMMEYHKWGDTSEIPCIKWKNVERCLRRHCEASSWSHVSARHCGPDTCTQPIWKPVRCTPHMCGRLTSPKSRNWCIPRSKIGNTRIQNPLCKHLTSSILFIFLPHGCQYQKFNS